MQIMNEVILSIINLRKIIIFVIPKIENYYLLFRINQQQQHILNSNTDSNRECVVLITKNYIMSGS